VILATAYRHINNNRSFEEMIPTILSFKAILFEKKINATLKK
jgi:hypothetical protein